MKLVLIYLLMINGISLIFYGLDKLFAVKDMWRIRDFTLLVLAAAGGSAGALLGMLLFRHKIRKAKFFVTVPLLLALHAGLLFWLKSFLV